LILLFLFQKNLGFGPKKRSFFGSERVPKSGAFWKGISVPNAKHFGQAELFGISKKT